MGLRGQRLLDQDSAAAAAAEPGTWRLEVQFQLRDNFDNITEHFSNNVA
jgi:hypothetical protein